MRRLTSRRSRFIFLGLVALLLTTPHAEAGDSSVDRDTLKGMNALSVITEYLDPEVEREGVTRSQIQVAVESHLREAGIRVLPEYNPPLPYLYVQVVTRMTKSGFFAYSVRLDLKQPGVLSRDPNIEHPAVVTWSVETVGALNANRLYEIRPRVIDLVERFIAAYLEQNPNH